ncbi:hypothetical protein [Streptomyces sp. NPDC017529]|uniref:hypothetical protein n=1 Tax=Streptomyces sp. NPDC017529 TaxID=3365000 RepID=UPI0037A0F140
MSDDSTRDGRDGDARVYPFPRLGFRLSPASGTPSGPPVPSTPDVQAPAGTGSGTEAEGRRSPLDIVDALPAPDFSLAPVAATPSPEGGLPDTFRGTSDSTPQDTGGRMGALSLAAILAVAVAALRGTSIALEDWRQRRMQKRAEGAPLRQARLKHQLAMEQAAFSGEAAQAKHQQAMNGIGDKAAQERAKQQAKVPSSLEFGRKAAGGGGQGSGGGRGGAGSSGANGTGPGRGNKPGSGPGNRSSSGAGLSGGGVKGSGSRGPGSGGSDRNSAGRGRGGGGTKDRSASGGGSRGGAGSGAKGTTNTGGRNTGTGTAGKSSGGTKHSGGGSASGGSDRTKAPKRSSQGAGAGLKKQQNKANQDRTRLPDALKDTAQKAAARRLNSRRSNLDKPAVWKDPKNTQGPQSGTKTPLNKKDTKGRTDQAKGPDLTKGPPKDGKETPGTKKPKLGPDAATTPRRGKNDPGTDRKDHKGAGGTRGTDRTSLWDALKKDTADSASNRWGQRATDRGVPPLWKNDKQRTKKKNKAKRDKQEQKKTGPKKSPKDGPKAASAGPKTRTKKAAGGTGPQDRWTRMRDRARRAYDSGAAGPGMGTPGPDAASDWAQDFQDRTGGQAGPRRSPFEHAASTGPTTFTVDRDDYVGAQARRWEPDALTQGQAALPAAPVPHTPRPGTTRPHPAPPAPAPASARTDPRLKEARTMAHQHGTAVAHAARQMDAQHATEINLDDALDEYDVFAADGFKTHEQCLKLSNRARALRDTLAAFAADLAVNHNLIGRLFTGSMARLSESMDLLARMADEMQISSLHAAEMAEAANDDLNDTYRPWSQATADAGLTTPSAPIHNQS